jgi:hypothetical protein
MRGLQRSKDFSFQTEVARLAESLLEAALLAKRRTWEERLRRRFALMRADSVAWSRAATGKVYRLLRDRV